MALKESTMLSWVCIRVLLAVLALQFACGGAGVLRRSAELAANKETVSIATRQPSSSNKTAQESGSGVSGSGEDRVQPEQTGSKNSTEAPTATESTVHYECPLPWRGQQW